MFLMKAQFMHDIFNINSTDPAINEQTERKDSSIIQVIVFTHTDNLQATNRLLSCGGMCF